MPNDFLKMEATQRHTFGMEWVSYFPKEPSSRSLAPNTAVGANSPHAPFVDDHGADIPIQIEE
jgi:hypothetical protein